MRFETFAFFAGLLIAASAVSPSHAGEGAAAVVLAQAEPEQGEPAPAEAEPTPAPVEEPPAESVAAPAPEEAAPPPTVATIHVIAENVEVDQGTVWVALCSSSLSVEGCPYKMSAPASAAFVEMTFEDIAPGVYAVAGYQDLNDNSEFDKLLGLPREPYALSGAAAEKLVPTFDDAALEFPAGPNDVMIRMKRLGG